MRQLLGTKIGMTAVFTETGDRVSVTVVQAGPCPVLRVKTGETDGYSAVVLGYGSGHKRNFNRPAMGFFAKVGAEPVRLLRELRLPASEEVRPGDVWTVEVFKPGDKVRVIGVSKGKGFQGAVRRHHFSGGPKTHGQSDRLRAPGSVGASSYPSRTFRGQRMAGRMGNQQVTLRNVKVVDIDTEKNLILLKGAVPGARNGLIVIRN